MKISYNWLQKYFENVLPEPEVVADGIIFHSFEIEETEKVGDDTIFEIKILPDRAHDCLSHWGIAKEISVIFDIKIRDGVIQGPGERESMPDHLKKQSDGDVLQIEVKSPNCRRYMGRIVKGVKVGPSPEWLSKALINIGQKSINNIVDATNYVMFDLGNPIHAFDLDKLASHKIIVQNAVEGEKITLLDGKEVILDSSILTIRDEEDILVVAGVKGGKKAEIDNDTANIMIEVANFEPVSVRKAAGKLNIFTESAKRFENEISPMLTPLAMEKITKIILELAGGQAYEIVDIYNEKEEEKIVNFNQKYLNNLLGVEISEKEINNILERFGYQYKIDNGEYQVTVSPLRLDLNEAHDMVEEIGRIYGYDKVSPVLPKIDFEIKENETWRNINFARNYLTRDGYREVMTYSFSNKGDLEVMASASDKNFLRKNLTDGVKKSYEFNKLNAPILGNTEIKIFEIGAVFPSGKEIINVCLANKKEVKEMSLDNYIISLKELYAKENSLSNSFSEVLGRGGREPGPDHSQKHTDSNSNSGNSVFKSWSVYPYIVRDISVWASADIDGISSSKDKLVKIYKEFSGELLNGEPILFDEFTKGDKTSYAYRLIFQSFERTLTDEEVTEIMTKINGKIMELGWEVR